jgi:hypothetical protein
MTFEPYPTRSGFIFLSVALASALIAIYLLLFLFNQPEFSAPFSLTLWLLLALMSCGVATYGALVAFRLEYHLDRNGLIIQWGSIQHLIPFDKIDAIVPGNHLSPLNTSKMLNIAGLRFGWGHAEAYGLVRFHATTDLQDSLLIVTPHLTYVISPRQPQQLIRAWQARQSLGPTQAWPLGLRHTWPWNTPFFADQWGRCLASLTILLCLSLFAYLSSIMPNLPTHLPVHFNALGQPDRIAARSALLILPIAGGGVFLFNTILGSLVYQREKVAAYLLWGSMVIIQLCLWVALLTLTA